MKTLVGLTLAALIFGASAQAQAPTQQWVGIDGSETSILGYDRGSVRPVGEGKAAWVITVFRSTQPDDGQDYDFVVSRHVFDCDNERVKTTTMRSFRFGTERPGRVTNDEGEWVFHQPESIFGMLVADVCGVTSLERQPFASANAFAEDARNLLLR